MKRGITDIIGAYRGSTPINKILRGTTLIWQLVVDAWANIVALAYEARVEADYGTVEDKTVLQAELELGTEQDYLDAIAIYNPNGGKKVGKIYDVRDTGLVKSFVPNKASLFPASNGTITGGFLDYQNSSIAEKLEYKDTKNLYVFTAANANSGNTTLVMSAEVKKGNLRYVRLAYFYFVGSLTNNVAYFDLDTLTYVTADNRNTFEDLGNGWIRLMLTGDATTSDNVGQYLVGFTSISNGVSATVGDFGYIGRIQAIENPTYVLSENNPSTDLTVTGGGGTRFLADGTLEVVPVEMPKIDYSTVDARFLIETERTNRIIYSYDFTQIYHNPKNGIITSLNEQGILGLANTATTLTDSNTANYGEINDNIISVPASSSYAAVCLWFKKDQNETRFPEVFFAGNNNGIYINAIQINTKTGALGFRSGNNTKSANVFDRGLWWELFVVIGSGANDINSADVRIRPAMGNSLGTFSGNALGSIILGHFDVFVSNNLIKSPVTPIITNGLVVTRTASTANITTPSGVSSIEEKVDGVVNTITTIPTTYTMPNGAVEYVKFL